MSIAEHLPGTVEELAALFRREALARQPISSFFAVRHQPAAPDIAPAVARPEGAAHFCMVYRGAGDLGWWVYPPFDAQIIWRGGREFEVRIPPEAELNEALWKVTMATGTGWASGWHCSKIDGVLQVDPGLTFVSPLGVKLLLTDVLNRPPQGRMFVQSGVLDADWFWIPSTINLQFTSRDEPIQLDRSKPLAQVIPLDSARSWTMETIDDEQFAPSRRLLAAYQDHKYGPVSDWGGVLPEAMPGTYAKLQRLVHSALYGEIGPRSNGRK